MMETSSPDLLMLVLAVGAGLLAVFVVWVSKQIANEKTRAQGITAAAIALGLLVLGFLIVPTSTVHMAPATVTPGVASGSSVSIDQNGMQVHTHRGHPSVAAPSASEVNRGIHVGYAGFAWGPMVIAVIAVGVIVIVVSSKRGLAAALACLGIVAFLVMYVFAARNASFVARVPQAASVETPWDAHHVGSPSPTFDAAHTIAPQQSVTVPEEIAAAVKAEDVSRKEGTPATKPSDDIEAEAESPAADQATPPKEPKEPLPAWVGSEPNMDAGVYSSVVVSGPYSTKRECLQRQDDAIGTAVRDFTDDFVRPRSRYPAWTRWKNIEDRLVDARHFQQVQTSVGPMWNLHVLLTIDQADQAYFQQVARNYEVQQAVEEASIGGLLALGALAVLYGALKFPCRKRCAAVKPATSETPDTTA